MDEIERKTMQDIKDYVKSLDTPDNEVYQQNSLLIMSCFSKAIEFIEQNAKLRQPAVIKSLPDSDEIRMKARELDEKDFAQWMWELQKGNVL
jgi:hypothetical protein